MLPAVPFQLTADDRLVLAEKFRDFFLAVTRLQQRGNLIPLFPGQVIFLFHKQLKSKIF